MKLTVQEKRYFDQMDSALADKTRVLDYLPHLDASSAVADMGAGSGALAQVIHQHTRATVYAVDTDRKASALISCVSEETCGGVISVREDFSFLHEAATAELFDAVVCSSVLGEIYAHASSTNTSTADPHRAGHTAWVYAITGAAQALKPGGRLIIRDNVAPGEPSTNLALRQARLIAQTPEDNALIQQYVRYQAGIEGSIRLTSYIDEQGRNTWRGYAIAVAEALLFLNWVDPHTGAHTLEDFSSHAAGGHRSLGTLHGYPRKITEALADHRHELTLVHAEEYIQPGYVASLENRIKAEVEDTSRPGSGIMGPWFPSTKALWVFEKK